MDTGKLHIPYPPDKVFLHRSAPEAVVAQGTVTHLLDHFEYPETGGILVHIVDAKFPKKGFPYPDAIWAINVVKKFFIESVKILSNLKILTLLIFLPSKRKIALLEKTLQSYNRLCQGILEPIMLKSHYLTPCSREMGAFIHKLLTTLGIENTTAFYTAQIVQTVIEYDDAYRYRIQDVVSETSKELLIKNPRKEIQKNVLFGNRKRFK